MRYKGNQILIKRSNKRNWTSAQFSNQDRLNLSRKRKNQPENEFENEPIFQPGNKNDTSKKNKGTPSKQPAMNEHESRKRD